MQSRVRPVSLTQWADRLCSHSRLIRESLAPEVVDGRTSDCSRSQQRQCGPAVERRCRPAGCCCGCSHASAQKPRSTWIPALCGTTEARRNPGCASMRLAASARRCVVVAIHEPGPTWPPQMFPKYSDRTVRTTPNEGTCLQGPCAGYRRSEPIGTEHCTQNASTDREQGVAGSNPVSPTEEPALTCGNAGRRRFLF